MKIDEVKKLSDEELQAELGRKRRYLFDLRSQSVTEKLEDSTLIAKAKRDIARMLTVQKERQIAAEQSA